MQFPTEELVKEVENSIAEFKRQNQEYDEERVKDQVRHFWTETLVKFLLTQNRKTYMTFFSIK